MKTDIQISDPEQYTLRLADRCYVLETGAIMLSGTGKELMGNPQVREAYLGGVTGAILFFKHDPAPSYY
jgi:branched-chain amino acid transport system ATP-binding protein